MQHQISLAEAIELTQRYRNNPVTGMPRAETFEAVPVNALLAQSGCASMRIYAGRKEDQSLCSILVGVDAEGRDILSLPDDQLAGNDDDDGIILEDAFKCPPVCGEPSPLNP